MKSHGFKVVLLSIRNRTSYEIESKISSDFELVIIAMRSTRDSHANIHMMLV